MDITLIICTYNRCQSLTTLLESVSQSTLPDCIDWEVLVVNNNSSDGTCEVVDDFRQRHSDRFRYFFQPRQGKSFALNSGVQEALGDILVFTDDDVTVEPDWLQNLTANLHGGEWVGAAGRVLRTWTCAPPRWLSLQPKYEKMAWALVSFDLNRDAGELPSGCPPVGANMAFRKEMFSKHGGFRIDLGPRGNDTGFFPGQEVVSGVYEDTEFGRRLLQEGERLRYEPSAVVYHPVPERRLTKRYFLEWWFGRGRDTNRVLINSGPVWGIPRYYIRIPRMTTQLLANALAWLTAVKAYRRFYYKLLTWETAGAIMGAIALRRSQVHGD